MENGEEVNSVIPRKGQISPLQTQATQLAEKLDSVTLSPEVINRQPVEEVTFTDRQDDDLIGDLNIRILVEMIERFTGKKIHITKSVGAIENVSLKQGD
ncbi:MAG: hypothetical protein GY705_07090, partial [Bacteroidetes bacterium]|nr:hypothetical protein [Bacteroidota bacterium]